jgi:hypothetical protein
LKIKFSVEELLNENVCQWCSRKNCPLKDKINNEKFCSNFEFDKTQKERHDKWNQARQKIALIHALIVSNKPHDFSDPEFREWVKQNWKKQED